MRYWYARAPALVLALDRPTRAGTYSSTIVPPRQHLLKNPGTDQSCRRRYGAVLALLGRFGRKLIVD